MVVLTLLLFSSGTALTGEVMKALMGALSQTFWTIGVIMSREWVEMLLMENIKFRQGGWKGRTWKVMAVEDHTHHSSMSCAWSSVRL